MYLNSFREFSHTLWFQVCFLEYSINYQDASELSAIENSLKTQGFDVASQSTPYRIVEVSGSGIDFYFRII